MTNDIVSAIGLFFDIAGVLLIFRFGISPRISSWLETDHLSVSSENESKEKKYSKLNQTGLALMVIGFILQFLGNDYIFSLSREFLYSIFGQK